MQVDCAAAGLSRSISNDLSFGDGLEIVKAAPSTIAASSFIVSLLTTQLLQNLLRGFAVLGHRSALSLGLNIWLKLSQNKESD